MVPDNIPCLFDSFIQATLVKYVALKGARG